MSMSSNPPTSLSESEGETPLMMIVQSIVAMNEALIHGTMPRSILTSRETQLLLANAQNQRADVVSAMSEEEVLPTRPEPPPEDDKKQRERQ